MEAREFYDEPAKPSESEPTGNPWHPNITYGPQPFVDPRRQWFVEQSQRLSNSKSVSSFWLPTKQLSVWWLSVWWLPFWLQRDTTGMFMNSHLFTKIH